MLHETRPTVAIMQLTTQASGICTAAIPVDMVQAR